MRRAAFAIALAGLLLAGCDAVFGLTGDDTGGGSGSGSDDMPKGPVHTRRILITPPVVLTNETLINFPVLVRLNDDEDLSNSARNSGRDIRFFDSSENELNVELVHYEEGSLEAWVRVPQLVQPQTQIEMRYGGTELASLAPQDVWGSAFYAAYHMDNDAEENDSTRTGFDMYPTGNPRPFSDDNGVVGKARRYLNDDVDAQKLCATDPAVFPPEQNLPVQSFALTMWIMGALSAEQFSMPFEAGGSNTNIGGVAIEQNRFPRGSSSAPWNVIFTAPDGSHQETKITDTDPVKWIHLGVVFAHSNGSANFVLRLYANGERKDLIELPFDQLITADSESRCLGGDNPYGGLLDEVRIYQEDVSDTWMAAEYANIATPSLFIDVGAPE